MPMWIIHLRARDHQQNITGKRFYGGNHFAAELERSGQHHYSGRTKLGFIVTGGNMDSMVNHYSVSKKRRQKDAFTPGGVMGKRPDYATIVYCNLIRRTYKHNPLIIGGLEASLRRLAHYDYWSNKVKRSILLDSGADLLLYGMGERSIMLWQRDSKAASVSKT